ncbi:LysE family transporter [Alphaproteobacteria bacterium]|jgi:threonine/homoserine/homoserine lactone efflux protein|nr:LysE family transporter [Alphaproteobacteria bacterium]MDA9958565.1 LysE family transporter [Alphaproteobacteria bacterium]MDB2637781.1 LysE family transporter [Alphaproteobacteria bacterium]MDC0100892.1 LysE family transporter [Alphaproteobacteria bacterium]MDC1037351.1 LysE family transporter [Alphaproteobacteria bacterium]
MIAFALAVCLLLVTPGPGVLSLAGVGAAFGWRQGISYLSGLFIGNNLVCIAVISGLATMILASPSIRMALLIISAAYLGYLAFRIAFSSVKIAFIQMPKPGLGTGTTIQLINPKAYAVHITLFSGFAFYPNDFFIETAVKLLIANVIWILIHFFWLYLGVKINQLELPEKTQRIINVFMAICLLAVVGLSVWSIIS